MFKLYCNKNDAYFQEVSILTSGRVGEQISFTFSPDWDGLLKTAVFIAGKESRDVVLTEDTCNIPPEVLVFPGEHLRVGVFGETSDKMLVIPTIYASAGTIRPGASPSGMSSTPPSPSWPEQVQAIAAEAKEVADSVRSDADAGKFTGTAGTDGGYYTPEVTQTSENTMQVAFSPSKTSMPAVSGTEITLPAGQKGDKGDTGATGADGKSAYAYAVEGGYTGTEEEFAAKLAAEKFANPNALTFTGAVTGSYDGSEAVTVEIPSGGGNADRKWSLIKTLNVSTDAAQEYFDTDDDGNSFSVQEILITGIAPNIGAGYLYCRPSLAGQVGNLQIWPTASKKFNWYLGIYNNILKTTIAVSNNVIAGPVDKNVSCPERITELTVGASAGYNEAGTIYVYGR